MKVLIMSKDGLEAINLNRRKAIHERCLNCTGWHAKDVTDCQFTKCPLYPFRTGDGKQNAIARNKAIKDYCLSCSNGQIGEVTKCPSNNCPLYIYRKGGLENAIKPTSFEKIDHIDDTFRVNLSNLITIHGFRKSA